MNCPKCKTKMKVYSTKLFGTKRKRVYICPQCKKLLTTMETVQE